MLIALVLVVVGVIVATVLVSRWNWARELRRHRSPPLVFPLDDRDRSPLTPLALRPSLVARRPVALSPRESPASSAMPSSPPVGVPVPLSGAAGGGAAALAPRHPPAAHAPPMSNPAPPPLRVVRDDPAELAIYQGEPVSDETVRFRRPSDEPVQLLPGRLEVVAGDPQHREIRFVRIPGRLAELILGREPGDSAQHVALRSTTVSRRHARFAFLDGRWTVMNLSRTNPIVINGVELSSSDASYDLRDGDRLELGEVVFRFHVQ